MTICSPCVCHKLAGWHAAQVKSDAYRDYLIDRFADEVRGLHPDVCVSGGSGADRQVQRHP